MRSAGLARGLLLTLALAVGAGAAEPLIPQPKGFVTDLAGVIPPDVQQRMTRTIEELRAKTGSEIAVLTVPTTEPLDDFTYAMRVADAWKVGGKGQDTGVLIVAATQDRKLRILTGYGVEGILPDGLVGQIQDREMLPSFRAGKLGEGLERGVAAIAQRISDAHEGKPPPTEEQGVPVPPWLVLLIFLLVFFFLSWLSSRASGAPGARGYRRFPGGFAGGGWGGGFPPGGFGGGGGGFDGFGGGRFGGGGAGRSW